MFRLRILDSRFDRSVCMPRAGLKFRTQSSRSDVQARGAL